MSDTVGASALLNNGGPAAPGGPGPTPSGTAPTPQQVAAAELAAAKADPEFVRKYLAGDADAKAKMQSLHERVYAGVTSPAVLNDRAVDSLSRFADLSPEVQQQIRDGRPVSEAEYKMAVHRREQLMRDEDWRDRYFRGDRDARREMALVTVVLSSRLALEQRR